MKCTADMHERLKSPSKWQLQKYVGLQPTYDEPGKPTHLEMRNTLCCGTTLCVPVTVGGDK